MNHDVAVTLTAVAIPNAARVLEPVVPVPARYIVSDVIAIVTVTPVSAINPMVVPIGYATVALAGIVTVEVAVT